jgi:hypothetical protein
MMFLWRTGEAISLKTVSETTGSASLLCAADIMLYWRAIVDDFAL